MYERSLRSNRSLRPTWIAAVVLLVLILVGVSNASAARTVEHAMGRTVISGTPNRVVALEFSFIDALVSLGITPVGIADDGDPNRIIPAIRSQLGEWASVGTRGQPNLEIIATLEPDLIIADLQRHSAVYDDLGKIAPTIVLPSLEATYRENLDSMLVIGEALNRADAVEARLKAHQEKMAALRARVPKDESRNVLSAVVWDEGFNAHTSSAYTPGVLEAIGLTSAIQSEEPYARLNLEQLVRINPDILFLMASTGRTVVDEWESNPLWQHLTAVRNCQVYYVDRNLWSRFRGIISAELIAKKAVQLLYGEEQASVNDRGGG